MRMVFSNGTVYNFVTCVNTSGVRVIPSRLTTLAGSGYR